MHGAVYQAVYGVSATCVQMTQEKALLRAEPPMWLYVDVGLPWTLRLTEHEGWRPDPAIICIILANSASLLQLFL